MFNIKKKGRTTSQRFHRAIKESLYPHFIRLGNRLKVRQRIRLANIWARRHPKKLMINYSAFAVLLIGITLLSDFLSTKPEEPDFLGMRSIPSMNHRIRSMNNTEVQNERIRQEVYELGNKGMRMYNELDSLMKLPVKTRDDSVRIIQNYNILNETFNSNEHEP